MAWCGETHQEVELTQGNGPSTLVCPACGWVLDEDSLERKEGEAQ